ncbi:dTDP-4-dehydrorhamnose 3,5-epimerase [Pelagibacteraceae bacterium]|nr:dTDP-4-dehydrorhamnose 3,5-epimerase [Pelagibacteraceae bacterium]
MIKISNRYFENKIILIKNKKFLDSRGYFLESFNLKNFNNKFKKIKFVQDNFSFSKKKFTLRGLHYQKQPFAQKKLIQVLRGKIIDIVVDINPKSKNFGTYKKFLLSATNCNMLFIDDSFAHGFCTMEENTLVHYKVNKYYNKNSEKTISWNDQTLKIEWPKTNIKFNISKKDKKGESFKKLFL